MRLNTVHGLGQIFVIECVGSQPTAKYVLVKSYYNEVTKTKKNSTCVRI